MSHSGSDFYKPFIFVLGALVLLTIFLVFVANSLSPDSGADPLAVAETKKSIAPVGRSRVVELAQPAESADDGASTESSQTESTAAASNQVQSAETEKVSDQNADNANAVEDEASKADEGSATIENTATTDEVKAESATAATGSLKVKAVVATNCAGCHNDGLDGAAKTNDAAAWSALAESGIDQLTASVIKGKGNMPARAESTLNDDEIRQAVELMIMNATGATPAVSSATATTEAETVAAAPTGEIPAEIKKVVDTACAACHLAGVANAPKFGDKDAWAPRLDDGIEASVARAIAGQGVMPPRGGTTLDDDQMRLAVEYMLSK